jgi:hypothetical protein
MFRHVPAFAAACVLAALPAVAQDHAGHQEQAKLMKGASVAIEGCVTAAENDDAFVLAAVREIPGRPIESGLRVFYRLDSVKELRGRVGQVVRVDGRIDGVTDGNIEIKPGKAKDGGTLVELELPGRDIDTTPAVAGVAGVTGTSGKAGDEPKMKITVIKLDVDKVTTVKASCAD